MLNLGQLGGRRNLLQGALDALAWPWAYSWLYQDRVMYARIVDFVPRDNRQVKIGPPKPA